MSLIVLHKVVRLFPRDALHVGHFVPELHTVEFVGVFQQLWSESCGDELRIFAEFVDHVSNCFSVLSIKCLCKENGVLVRNLKNDYSYLVEK